MASRLQDAMGTDGAYDVQRKFALEGIEISVQAIYKWLNGGDIGEANLEIFCRIYNTTPPWIRYGIRPSDGLTNGQAAAAELLESAPNEPVQTAFDFLGYQLRQSPMLAQERVARYMALIDRIKADMNKRAGP